MSEVRAEDSTMSAMASEVSEVGSGAPVVSEGQLSALGSGTETNINLSHNAHSYMQGYTAQANYELLSNFEENVTYGDYYNYYNNYYQHLQVKGQPYLPESSQSQSVAIAAKANTRDLINKALARQKCREDTAKDDEEEEGQIPASPRAFNRSPSPSTPIGSVHNSRYSRSKSVSRSRSVSKERPLRSRSRSRSRSRKRYISRSRSRSPRRRHRSRSRSPYFGPIIKDYRRGRRGYVRYPRGFRDRGSRPYRRGHPCRDYSSAYYSQSRRHDFSHSRSRSPSPMRRHIEVDKLDHSDEEKTLDSRNSETLKPSDINMSAKLMTQSFLAMLEDKRKQPKMIPIETRRDNSESNDKRGHGFVNTFNSVAGRQLDSGKHTLSYDLESEGWQVIDDANTDSRQMDKSNEEDDYKDETNEDLDCDDEQPLTKKSDLKSSSSDEDNKTKRKKAKKDKKRKKRKVSTTSDSSDSDSDNENDKEIENKKKSKKKKKNKKRKRRVSSSSSSSDDEKSKKQKKKKRKKESSNESDDEDESEANKKSALDPDLKEAIKDDSAISETKEIAKIKEKKKKHKSDSSDTDSNKKKKKKSKKKSSKKRKRRSSSSSSSNSSDSSDSNSKKKKKKKKKSKKNKSKKQKKKGKKEKTKTADKCEDKKKVKHESDEKDGSEVVIVLSVGEPPLELKWPKKLIKQTHCLPSLQFSINPKVMVNADDFKEVKLRSHCFESRTPIKESIKLVSEYERFIDELNPNMQNEGLSHHYEAIEGKLTRNMSDKIERQEVMTSAERRALEKLKKQSLHCYETNDDHRRHEDMKSAPINAYYSAKVQKTCPLKASDKETKCNKSNEFDIKSNETISLSLEERSHRHESNQSEVNKIDDKKRTAQELLERVKQRRHSSKDNKDKDRQVSKQLPHIGKMKAKKFLKKGSVTTANADSTQSAFVSQPMALDMNYDYNWYYNYYMNSVYGVAQCPQVNDPSLASAYYAYYSMLTSCEYSQTDLNEWAAQHGLTIDNTLTTAVKCEPHSEQLNDNNNDKTETLDKKEEDSQIDEVKSQSTDHQTTSDAVITDQKPTNDSKNIEVLVSVTACGIPDLQSEESKPNLETSPFLSTNFQQKVKVRVTATSPSETESTQTEANGVARPPPPPPRPMITRLISAEPVTLTNGHVLPAGTKQVVVHPYQTEDRNQFTAQWFVDAFSRQNTTESNT